MAKELPLSGGFDSMQFVMNPGPNHRKHEWRFARMLEAADKPESTEGKQIIERLLSAERRALEEKVFTIGRELASPDIAAHTQMRELLSTESIESTTLVQTEFYNTVLEGAEPNKVMRNVLRSLPMKSNTQSITLGESGSVLKRVSEGAELPSNQQDYTPVTLTSYKYGEKNIISNELIDDSLYDIMALEVAKSGARAENTLNHVSLTTLLDDAGNEHDCGNTNVGAKALAGARKEMKKDGYLPTVLVGCAEAGYQLEIDTNLSYANQFGNPSVIQNGTVGMVMGMNFVSYDPFDTDYNSDTYTWSYDTDGDIGMVALDPARLSAVIGMKRDITVKDYDDPVRDLKGAALTMRFATESPFDNGICRIKY